MTIKNSDAQKIFFLKKRKYFQLRKNIAHPGLNLCNVKQLKSVVRSFNN